ncbi:MAG: ABC transporter permease [Bacilli bacterium]|nr:ABC transporter permease [Bacilli bacterium]
MSLFKELFQYRELLKTNVHKEIRGKYKGSILGVLWSFLNPLLMVAVYAIVFPYLMRMEGMENYLVFLITGVIPWVFFTTVVTTGCNCVWINGGIIKKVYFPREILPISVVIAGLINFLISCVIILLFAIFGGIGIGVSLAWLPVIALIQSVFSLGLLFILCAINVYIRDVEYIVQFIMNLVFYATPIIYQPSMLPEKFKWILYMNPMAQIIDAYRSIFYYKTSPDIISLIVMAVVAFVVLIIGYGVFKKLERGFAEEV